MDVTPNKNYSVWLHFAEIDNGVTAEEQRVFDVLINGDTAFKDVDIIRMTGERFTALVLNKTVAVSGTTLKIILQPVKGTRAIISAIEVFEVIPAEKKTLPQEGGCLIPSKLNCLLFLALQNLIVIVSSLLFGILQRII